MLMALILSTVALSLHGRIQCAIIVPKLNITPSIIDYVVSTPIKIWSCKTEKFGWLMWHVIFKIHKFEMKHY